MADYMKDMKYYQYHSHQPYSNGPWKNNDELRIVIQSQESSTVPGDSKICIEGELSFKKNRGLLLPLKDQPLNSAVT